MPRAHALRTLDGGATCHLWKPIGLAAFLTFEASGDNCSKSSLGADVYSEGDDALPSYGDNSLFEPKPLSHSVQTAPPISSGVRSRS